MKQTIRLNADQIVAILTKHIAENRRAFCVPDNFHVEVIHWILDTESARKHAIDLTLTKDSEP